jgi:hypothetical protein
MTRLLHPPERDREDDRARFDPVREGARHRLPPGIAIAIWDRVCADAGALSDAAAMRQRFHELAARIAVRGARLQPDVGKLTRASGDARARASDLWTAIGLRSGVPGRETQISAAAVPAPAAERGGAEPRAAGATGEDRAIAPHGGFAAYREIAIHELLERFGSDRSVRRGLFAAAADPMRSIAGAGGPPRDAGLSSGAGLWQVAERRAATLYRRATEAGQVDGRDPAVEAILRQRAAGAPLPDALRRDMEAELGVSLAGVRIHTDAAAAHAARAVSAAAFTVGEDVYFSAGAYAPESRAGRKLIAHELAHVAQALSGRTAAHGGGGGGGLRVSQPDEPLEREADAVAERIDRGTAASRAARSAHDRAAAASRGAARAGSGVGLAVFGGAILRKPDDTPATLPAAPGAQGGDKANPYAAMTVEQRAAEIRKLLDKWLTSREILRAFEACDPRQFVELQRKVELAAVIEKLSAWDVVRLGALGPILAPQRPRVNEIRADLIQDITHKWGVDRAQVFVLYMFSTMPGDDATSVLQQLAAGQHLFETIDKMPLVTKLLDEQGVDRSKIKDRGWEAMDILRGLGRGLDGIMSTSDFARGNEGMRMTGMAQDLPSPYREAVDSVDQAAMEKMWQPGNVAFGAADSMTLGLLSMAKGVVYDVPVGIGTGVGTIADGHVAAGVEQLTGPAIFIVGAVLGVRAYRKSARLAAMLELTEEGRALYGTLKTKIGAQGIDKVAKYVQGSSDAQILVREEGAAGIEALYRAQGDVAAARAELAASRPAAKVAPPIEPEPAAPAVAPAPAGPRMVDASNKVSPTSAGGYRLNRKNIANVEKIQGQPESVVEFDANREAVAAELAAAKPGVQKVYLGTEADRFINNSEGEVMSADAVAVNKRGQYHVVEAKGMDIPHGLEQLEHTANQLGPSNVVSQTLVVPERISTPGYTVINGTLYLNGAPRLVAGKPVNVVFTTQR